MSDRSAWCRTAWLVALLALPACTAQQDRAAPAPVPTVTAPASSPAAPPSAPALRTQAGDLGCPASVPDAAAPPAVPAPPTAETPGRLVPDADPVEVLVCRYAPRRGSASSLAGEVVVTTGLDRVRTDLLLPATVPGEQRPCPLVDADEVPHLARLTYADGEVWLATGGPCDARRSSNGAFTSSAPLPQLAQAYDTRSWPAAPVTQDCSPGTGRAGQERVLVPDGWTAVLVCDPADGPGAALRRGTAAEVVDALRRVPTSAGTGTATCRTGARMTGLRFSYAAGPPVTVVLRPGCEPAVTNGSLDAAATPAQVTRLERLLR